MSQRIEKTYNPLDFEPDVAVGVMLPFNGNAPGRKYNQHYASGSLAGASVFALSYSTEEQAISNLKNLLLTRKGERFMQPDFGTIILDSIFEPSTVDLETRLQDGLNEDIEFWLPYININDIVITRNPDQYQINIAFHFSVGTQGANLVINILADENAVVVTELAQDTSSTLTLQQVDSFGY